MFSTSIIDSSVKHPVHDLVIQLRTLVYRTGLSSEHISAHPMIIPSQLISGISNSLENFYLNCKDEDLNTLFKPFITFYMHGSDRSYGRIILNTDPEDPFQLILIYHPKDIPTGTGRIHDHRRLCWSMALDKNSFEKTFRIDPKNPLFVREVSHKISDPADGVTFDGLKNPTHPYIHQIGFSEDTDSFRLHCYWAGPEENPNGLCQYVEHP